MALYRRQVHSIAKTGSSQLQGDVTFTAGSNVTITQSGQDLIFASTGGSGSGATQQDINQVAHGFSVGNAIAYDSGSYVKADSTSVGKLGFLVVTAVADANNFTAAQAGYYSTFSGLTADQYYFVDPSTPGALTTTEPSYPNYSNPVLHAVSSTAGWILPFRPFLMGQIVDGGSFTDTADLIIDGGSF